VTGHIVKRTGKKKIKGKLESLYYLVYMVNGKQKWEKVPPAPSSLQATRKEADKLLALRLNQIHGGEFIEPSDITFGEFKEVWLEQYDKGEVRPTTMDQYESLYRKHIIPSIGEKGISRLGVEDIQGFKSALQQKGLGPQMVKHNLRLVKQMLNHAVDWGYIRDNPAAKVRYPKIPRREKEMESSILTPAEIRKLLDEIPAEWESLLLVAITGGLRIGEILAMRWGNLDRSSGQYYVRETWVRPKKDRPAVFSPPKTESSIAPVDLTPVCLDLLRVHRGRQKEEKQKLGEEYKDQDLIFASSTGSHLHDSNLIKRVFKPALTDAGLRIIRFHDLRHTCASLLIDQGESPKYVQKQMRHASIDITFDRYGHLFPDENQEAAKRLDETLFGKTSHKSTARIGG